MASPIFAREPDEKRRRADVCTPPSPLRQHRAARQRLNVGVKLCIPDDQQAHIPEFMPVGLNIPNGAPIPRQGEVVYLSSTSAWGVAMVVHEWLSPAELRVEVWLEHIGAARHKLSSDSPRFQ